MDLQKIDMAQTQAWIENLSQQEISADKTIIAEINAAKKQIASCIMAVRTLNTQIGQERHALIEGKASRLEALQGELAIPRSVIRIDQLTSQIGEETKRKVQVSGTYDQRIDALDINYEIDVAIAGIERDIVNENKRLEAKRERLTAFETDYQSEHAKFDTVIKAGQPFINLLEIAYRDCESDRAFLRALFDLKSQVDIHQAFINAEWPTLSVHAQAQKERAFKAVAVLEDCVTNILTKSPTARAFFGAVDSPKAQTPNASPLILKENVAAISVIRIGTQWLDLILDDVIKHLGGGHELTQQLTQAMHAHGFSTRSSLQVMSDIITKRANAADGTTTERMVNVMGAIGGFFHEIEPALQQAGGIQAYHAAAFAEIADAIKYAGEHALETLKDVRIDRTRLSEIEIFPGTATVTGLAAG